MTVCTELCQKLGDIGSRNGVLPLHDELITQLEFSDDDQEKGRLLGAWHEIQQRTQCGFCKLVVAAVSSTVEANPDSDVISPDQSIRVLIFPGEQSFRLSYPSRLGLRLAFVAQDAQHVSAPDTMRTVDESGAQISQIVKWLGTCDKEHELCSLDPFEPVPKNNDETPYDYEFLEDETSNFRVIDLERGCVGRAALDSQYVTLSYVWGDLPLFKLRKDNYKELFTPGGLEAIRTDLPKTINDAIDLVKALEVRYLWVDALCLVQDDDHDVSLGVEMMNSIYHGSYFTIVAASGSDVTAGLPGIGKNPRNNKQIIKDISPTTKMSFCNSIDSHLTGSIYNKRAWTLQELILPRRSVIFVNGQIYFRCQEANWSEELWADKWTHWVDADDSNISRIPDYSEGFLPSLWAYQKICEEYSRRKLRKEGDALRALAGVTRPLAAHMRTTVVEGLPAFYLNHFLLFISSDGDLRRRPEFASFSWAGWEGKLMWPRENFEWYNNRGEHTWKTTNIVKYLKHNLIVKWKAVDTRARVGDLTSWPPDALTPLLKLVRQHPKVFTDVLQEIPGEGTIIWRQSTWRDIDNDIPSWRPAEGPIQDDDEDDEDVMFMQRATKESFREALELVNGQAEFDRLLRRIERTFTRRKFQNWMAGRYFRLRRAYERAPTRGPRFISEEAERGNYSFRQTRAATIRTSELEPETKDSRLEEYMDWAAQQTSNEGDAPTGTFTAPTFPPYIILHFVSISMHLVLGTAAEQSCRKRSSHFDRIPATPLLSKTNEVVGALHPDNLDLLEPSGSKVECLIISRCNTPTADSPLFALDGDSNTEKPWDLFWVLYIVWKEGIAERRGVGQVLSSALEVAVEPKPEIKTIMLG
ncbi:hypothetical protein FQN54_006099 [Arachnomyces sp. PD_36]|nr:hypothetical protein FQN54_006099 [Arachnomyces sp. PD_36]